MEAVATLILLAVASFVGAAEEPIDAKNIQRRQDFYGDYGDEGFVGALLEEDADDSDGVLYTAFAYDVDDEGADAPVYDYGDADYQGSEKSEKTNAAKKVDKRNDKVAEQQKAKPATDKATTGST